MKAYTDLNKNNVWDFNEVGVEGFWFVYNEIESGTLGVTGELETGTDGMGSTMLAVGVYSYEVIVPNGYNMLTPEDALGSFSITEAQATTVAFSLVMTALIGDRVWHDADMDGIQDSSEVSIDGVGVQLLDSTGALLQSTQTDDGGKYSFTVETGESYAVRVTPPPGFGVTTRYGGSIELDSNIDAFGYTETFLVSGSGANLNLDAGLTRSGYQDPFVGDLIWMDTNANGLQESGEPGLADITVNLLSGTTVVNSAITDSSGYYQLSVPNTIVSYRVQVVLPTLYAATAAYAGPSDRDSNIDSTGLSEPFILGPDRIDLSIDGGLKLTSPSSIGDRVWLDSNGDGIQSVGETGLEDVPVYLYDAAHSLIGTTATDSDGHYSFTGVEANAYYQIEFGELEEYGFTQQNVGSPDMDSDADLFGATTLFWLGAGMMEQTKDAGMKEAVKPLIGIYNSAYTQVNKLRVAKWEDAFEKPAGTIQTKANFIDIDPDRFCVYVVHPLSNTDNTVKDLIQVTIKTSSDVGSTIWLEETAIDSGNFWSKDWLLLTSVKVDDDYKIRNIADNAVGDPTFLVKLGDTVTATYGGAKAEATVPVEKTVKLHINILRNKAKADGGKEVITQATFESFHLKPANEIYAQVGIRFTATVQIVDPPAGVDLSDGFKDFLEFDADGKIKMTDEEKALLNSVALRTEAADDIEVYYVNTMAIGYAEAFIASKVPDSKYTDSIVSRALTPENTLAHEIGHVLMDDGDHPDGRAGVLKVNLMAFPAAFDEKVTDSRRISVAQATNMFSKRPNLLP